ncbi:MAG TPA: hypothetical protein VMH35_14865 [Streptosporangiaceae bacterium]|nr:hypothetical protein [Streptosporangiaceae bacterium]
MVAAERPGVVPAEIATGHCVALSHPRELAGRLASQATTPGTRR